jgi:hypothetical protein
VPTQYTESTNHPDWRKRDRKVHSGDSGRDLRDIGGPFYTRKTFFRGNKIPRQQVSGEGTPDGQGFYNYIEFDGVIWAVGPSSFAFPPFNASSDAELVKYGQTAVSAVRPTNSPASLANALIELKRDGIPHLLGSQTWEGSFKAIFKDLGNLPKKLSGEFLNVVFGWEPLISDITDFLKAVRDARDILHYFERNAGKVVRREFGFPQQRSVTDTLMYGNAGAIT